MKTKDILMLLCLSTSLASCKKDNVGDEIDKISMQYIPVLHPGNQTRLSFSSAGGIFDCSNVSIGYDEAHSSKEIVIRFGDSYIPDGQPCHDSYSHDGDAAHSSLTLDLEPGDYALELINKGGLLRSGLHIDDQKIMLVNGKGSYISFSQNDITYMQTPKDAIWGSADATVAQLQLFKDSLISRGCSEYLPALENGTYTGFHIGDGNFQLYVGTSTDPAFLMKSALDTADLHSIMAHFCNNNTLEKISLSDGKGNNITQY